MKGKILSKVLVAAAIATSTLAIYQIKAEAAPIKDMELTLKQPNGESIQCYTSGDEFYNYLHDSNNRAIVKDKKTGYYVYGKYVKDNIIPSRERVTNKNIKELKNIKNDSRVNINEVDAPLDEIKKERELLNLNQKKEKTKNIGKLNNLVIFIKFSDQEEITRSFSTYNNQFNGQGIASLNNYYKEVSYNKLDIETSFYPKAEGDKVISYTDNHPRSYYANVTKEQQGEVEQRLLKNAVEAVKDQIPNDLNIDSDNDGTVDNVCFVVKGATTGWSSLLWPHKWNMYFEDIDINGKKIDTYNFQLEDFIGDNGIGVLSHEMFHTLGAPDLYHYKRDGRVAVGEWDVMDRTNDIPQSMGAYMKMYYGKWIDKIDEIDKPGKYSIKSLNNEKNNSYIIKSPKSDSEYFVVEYRKLRGLYESGLPGQGMLVYRINSKYEGFGNADGLDEVYVYRPNGDLYNVGEIWDAALGVDKKDIKSNQLFLSDGTDSGISMENINVNGDTVDFDLIIDGKKGEEEKKTLPLDYKVYFDDTKAVQPQQEIAGQCVYGKNISNIELYVNGYKYMNAERSKLNDEEGKYKDYDLSKAAFKFNMNFSNWYEGNYPYKIVATSENGEKFTLKEGKLIVKKDVVDDKSSFKCKFNLGDDETLAGPRILTGECAYKKGISAVKLYVNGYEYTTAERYALKDSEHNYDGYDLSEAGFKFDLDFSRWYNYDYPYKVVAVDLNGQEMLIKEGYLKIRN